MILKWGFGIKGAAISTVLSRLLPALYGLVVILSGGMGIQVLPFEVSLSECRDICTRAIAMIRIGVFESISEIIYGITFTLMIRLSGELGSATQVLKYIFFTLMAIKLITTFLGRAGRWYARVGMDRLLLIRGVSCSRRRVCRTMHWSKGIVTYSF